MSKKEILIELLKQTLGERLTKLEKNEKEAEASLKLISTTYDGFSKKISAMVKSCEEKISKEKPEEIKKHINKPPENPKQKKKELITKPSKKQNITNNVSTITKKNIPEKTAEKTSEKTTEKTIEKTTEKTSEKIIKKTTEKITEKKTHVKKTKSSVNLMSKKLPERIRGKSIGGTRLPTESGRNTIAINPLGNNIKKKILGGNKKEKEKEKEKDNMLSMAPTRNTIGGLPKKMRTSKSMGKLNNKPSLKKNHDKKKDEIQKMVNEIKIINKDILEDDILTEEIKVEVIPPTLMSCYKKGILEKSILQFLTKKDKLELFACNKTLAKLNIHILNDAISSYKKAYEILIGETIDDKIKILEEKYTKEELNEPIKNFELSRGAQKAIGLLEDELYMRLFIRPVQEKLLDEIVIIYRIFCQFLGKVEFTEIKSDKIFWEKFSKFVLESKGEKKLSQFCNESISKFIFDNKNILKVKEMSRDMGEKLKPKYWSKICPTTGFFAFIIKDIVEYTGIIEDKKTQASRIKANYIYVKNIFEKMNKFVKFLEGLTI